MPGCSIDCASGQQVCQACFSWVSGVGRFASLPSQQIYGRMQTRIGCCTGLLHATRQKWEPHTDHAVMATPQDCLPFHLLRAPTRWPQAMRCLRPYSSGLTCSIALLHLPQKAWRQCLGAGPPDNSAEGVCLQGMSEDVSISRFFDEPMLLEMARQEASLGQIL